MNEQNYPTGAGTRPLGELQIPATVPYPALPVRDERRMAALAHGSALLSIPTAGLAGPLVAMVIWLMYRHKSTYVANQALQSLIFQVLVLITVGILGVMLAIAWPITIGLLILVIGLVLLPFTLILTILALALPVAGLLYTVYAALQAYQGRPFHYWLVGNLVSEQGWH
ncbi:MAG: DUF4870 domain-containing protein [Chloroflexi bacterium]|nr:DUF4870 domain-containing protein [Chloroflexota bacterium]